MSPNSIAIVVLSVALSICASVAAQPAQAAQAPATQPLSGADDPRDAARRFALAFQSPTRQGLRDVVCGKTPAEEHAADIWASSISGQFRVQEALRKLGDAEFAAFFGNPPSPRPPQDQIKRIIEDAFAQAKVEQAGDEARVTTTVMGQSDQLWLTRCDGKWKVWIGAVLRARRADFIDNYIRGNWDLGDVHHRIADEIDAGRIRTGAEASAALDRFRQEAMDRAGPTSRPIEFRSEAELEAHMKRMRQRELERDRLEREAATRPVGK